MQKRKRISGEERKKRIIDAAIKIFSEKGFQGTKTKEIAKAAGISEAMVFKYFKNKKFIY
ncbi:MAG: TetR/AcrR family transcriptional regulator, partial [Candidatus Marinimicrobia bacterium]|nr:TetR/AcrR family transcriptional regulator [Candidatus Neomarinimicrobiota bacterium]